MEERTLADAALANDCDAGHLWAGHALNDEAYGIFAANELVGVGDSAAKVKWIGGHHVLRWRSSCPQLVKARFISDALRLIIVVIQNRSRTYFMREFSFEQAGACSLSWLWRR